MSTEEIGRGGGKQTARVARTMESGANSLTHVHPILPRCIMEVARLPGKSKLQVWANQKHIYACDGKSDEYHRDIYITFLFERS